MKANLNFLVEPDWSGSFEANNTVSGLGKFN